MFKLILSRLNYFTAQEINKVTSNLLKKIHVQPYQTLHILNPIVTALYKKTLDKKTTKKSKPAMNRTSPVKSTNASLHDILRTKTTFNY